MRWFYKVITGTTLLLAFTLPAAALEYHYGTDLYDNQFYTSTSSNDALNIDSKDDSGGQTIVVKTDSMGGDGSTDSGGTLNDSPIVNVGDYVNPWGVSVEKQIDTDTTLNGLEGLSFNRLEGANTGGAGGMFTEQNQLATTNGHFGAVSIGSRNIFAYVYPSASNASMRKGAGHVDGTSVWNGNVALCGHNRGSWAFFGNLKSVQVGDIVTYRTSLGVRTYRVTATNKILATDTSVLNSTGANRMTLLTCIANQPAYRLCVVAQGI